MSENEGPQGAGGNRGGLEDLYLVVGDIGVEAAVGDGLHDALEEPMGIAGVFGDAGYAEDRGLPYVVGIYFSDGDVELVAHPGGDGLDDAALGLQRLALGDVEGESAYSYDQFVYSIWKSALGASGEVWRCRTETGN